MFRSHHLVSVALTTILVAMTPFNGLLRAQGDPAWLEAYPAFRIADNLYYIGSNGLASFLVTTPEGHILINSNLEASVPMLKESVEKLGFSFSDIRILLVSHAHFDHVAGSARLKELTGAQYMVMDADVPVVESGGRLDFQYGDDTVAWYPAAKVDRILHDGDEVRLGGVVLVAHLTPGHTKGCTTWTMRTTDSGQNYDVVIVGSPNVNPGYRLVDGPSYPGIASDFERTFRVLAALPCQIFLGAHGAYFDLDAKYEEFINGNRSAFVDPDGYRDFVAERETAFAAELKRQKGER